MASTVDRLRRDIEEILPGVIADRRYFHEHPELAFEEVETSRIVAERLASLGVDDLRTGIAKTGVTALIHGGKGPGKVVLLRADMDALPIHEQNDVPYRSTVAGKMHACGHDAHTAMLLGIARILSDRKSEFAGTIKLLFQPAEEDKGGAEPMIAAGVLSDPHVDVVFGMHMAQDMPLGTISTRPGPSMAAVDSAVITIRGKGGHGAMPQTTVDPIVIGAHIVTALQTIVSREVDPIESAVVTVGALISGEASNVIPDTAELRLTIRSFDPDVREQLVEAIERIASGVAGAMRAEVNFDLERGYPATINEPEMTDLVLQVAERVVGADNTIVSPPMMGAEDFSYFLEQRPGCFYFVGSANEEKGLVWSHHHPRFDIDEESMTYGMEVMVETVFEYLSRNPG